MGSFEFRFLIFKFREWWTLFIILVFGLMAINLNKGYSPHSPSGPISLLLSGHATAAVEGAMPLEHAIGEYSLRNIVLTPSELIQNGNLIIPNGHGLGGSINQEFIKKYGDIFTL